MPNWLNRFSEKVKGSFQKVPIEEVVLTILTTEDPRLLLRPLGKDWLCPFTGKRILVPDWDGSFHDLAEQTVIAEHLLALPAIQKKGREAQMKSWDELLESVIFARLQENPSYRLTSDKGDWICPHCLLITGVHLE